MKKCGIIFCCFIFLSAFKTQPLDERMAQEALPKAQGIIWEKMAGSKIIHDEKRQKFKVEYSEKIKDFSGKNIEIEGFMLPLDSSRMQKNFILSRRSPTCPFCLPGNFDEFITLHTAEPVRFSYNIIKMSGVFKLSGKPEEGVIFELSEAKIISRGIFSELAAFFQDILMNLRSRLKL